MTIEVSGQFRWARLLCVLCIDTPPPIELTPPLPHVANPEKVSMDTPSPIELTPPLPHVANSCYLCTASGNPSIHYRA